MDNILKYKGYYGKFGYEEGDEALHGTVININDVIHFQGQTIAELRQSFQESVEDYLAWCAEEGREPEKPYSGKFVVRIDPDLHKKISTRAQIGDKSLNQWVKETLERAIG
jgi:predicted HicB family RNase H-like nuclease